MKNFKPFLVCVLAVAMITCALAPSTAHAQAIKTTAAASTTVNTATGTVAITKVEDDVVSLEGRVDSISGTPNGYVLLQGYVLSGWQNVNTDTLKVTNKLVNWKVWDTGNLPFQSYRLYQVQPTGSQTTRLSITQYRRARPKGLTR